MREKTENQLKREAKVKKNRTFPVGHTLLLVLVLALQVALILWGIRYDPQPKDVIRQYDVTVQPREDGTLDITYAFEWTALDQNEPLTWVEIGMANEHYWVYEESLSANIMEWEKVDEDGYVAVKLLFRAAYTGGSTVRFSFTVNQGWMLCQDEKGYFYEFVPGWFNEIQVEHYTFTWCMDEGEDLVQEGHLDYGQYDRMFVRYDDHAFDGCNLVRYQPFDASGATNGLKEQKSVGLTLCIMAAAALIIFEVYIIDCYVSYGRGRGFITEYGHHVHVYGRTNPSYVRARRNHHATSGSGGRSGGGCACACACACAGGGRAGCSQKDTYGTDIRRGSR